MKQVLAILTLFVATCGVTATKPQCATVSVQTLPGSVAAGFHIALKGRKILEREQKAPGLADLTGHILELNYRKMQKEFDKLGCELQFYDYPFIPFDDYYTRDEMSFIRGRVPNSNVGQALSLVAKLIQNSCVLDEKGLAQAARSCVGGNRMRGSLSGVAAGELRKLLFPEDYPSCPTYYRGQKSSLEKVQKFMKTSFSPGNMIITVVGDLNAGPLQESIEKSFSGWGENISGIEVYKAKMSIPDKRTATLETRRKSQGYAMLVRPLKDGMNVNDIATALLFARQVSDAISFQLREKEGLAYSIGAGIRNIGGHYFLTLAMGTSPKFVKSSADRMNKMLESLLMEGEIPESELQRIRSSLLISRRMKRLTNVNKAFFNGLDLIWKRPQKFEERVDNAIRKVGVAGLENVKNLLNGPEIRILINATEKAAVKNDAGVTKPDAKHP